MTKYTAVLADPPWALSDKLTMSSVPCWGNEAPETLGLDIRDVFKTRIQENI